MNATLVKHLKCTSIQAPCSELHWISREVEMPGMPAPGVWIHVGSHMERVMDVIFSEEAARAYLLCAPISISVTLEHYLSCSGDWTIFDIEEHRALFWLGAGGISS